MNRNISNESSEELHVGRFRMALWKRTALAVIALALVVGSTGCAMDDLLTPFAGDIPFEQEQTVPSEMGIVDNTPTVPEDDSPLDAVDFPSF